MKPQAPVGHREDEPLRETLLRLGLTQGQAGRLFGVHIRTVRGWCQQPDQSGHREVPEPINRLLDLIEHVRGAQGRLETIAANLTTAQKMATRWKPPIL